MSRYRITGHIYYITTNIYNFYPLFTRPAYVIPLFDALHYYRHQCNIKLLGYVIMLDHLHLLLYPLDAAQITPFMRDFKKLTATRIIRQATVEQDQALLTTFAAAGQETQRAHYKVWQDSFWEMNLFSDTFVRQKLNYIHRNPLRAGLVTVPEAYPYSSYRNYVMGDESLIEMDKGWM